MVFQHFELFPHLTITENLTIAQEKVLGRSKDEARDKGLKLLDRVGLRRMRTSTRVSCPAVSSSAWRLPVRWRWTDLHALRRADLGPRSGDDQRGADVMVELAQEGMTMMCVTHEMGFTPRPWRTTRDLHGPRPDCGGCVEGRFLRQAALRPRAAVPGQDPAPLIPAPDTGRGHQSRPGPRTTEETENECTDPCRGLLFLLSAISTQAAAVDAVTDRIARSGVVAIGYRDSSPPFSYLDQDRRPIGYSIEICHRIVDASRSSVRSKSATCR